MTTRPLGPFRAFGRYERLFSKRLVCVCVPEISLWSFFSALFFPPRAGDSSFSARLYFLLNERHVTRIPAGGFFFFYLPSSSYSIVFPNAACSRRSEQVLREYRRTDVYVLRECFSDDNWSSIIYLLAPNDKSSYKLVSFHVYICSRLQLAPPCSPLSTPYTQYTHSEADGWKTNCRRFLFHVSCSCGVRFFPSFAIVCWIAICFQSTIHFCCDRCFKKLINRCNGDFSSYTPKLYHRLKNGCLTIYMFVVCHFFNISKICFIIRLNGIAVININQKYLGCAENEQIVIYNNLPLIHSIALRISNVLLFSCTQ